MLKSYPHSWWSLNCFPSEDTWIFKIDSPSLSRMSLRPISYVYQLYVPVYFWVIWALSTELDPFVHCWVNTKVKFRNWGDLETQCKWDHVGGATGRGEQRKIMGRCGMKALLPPPVPGLFQRRFLSPIVSALWNLVFMPCLELTRREGSGVEIRILGRFQSRGNSSPFPNTVWHPAFHCPDPTHNPNPTIWQCVSNSKTFKWVESKRSSNTPS